jgi:hypothetical protein
MKAMVDDEFFKAVKDLLSDFSRELDNILKAEIENMQSKPEDEYTEEQREVLDNRDFHSNMFDEIKQWIDDKITKKVRMR